MDKNLSKKKNQKIKTFLENKPEEFQELKGDARELMLENKKCTEELRTVGKAGKLTRNL